MAQLYIDNAKKLKVRIDNNQKIVDTVEAAGGIETTLTQSDKIGFDWLNFYVNKVLVRQEYKEQEPLCMGKKHGSYRKRVLCP